MATVWPPLGGEIVPDSWVLCPYSMVVGEAISVTDSAAAMTGDAVASTPSEAVSQAAATRGV